jgi:hypothetical protein
MARHDFEIIDQKPIGCGQFGTVFRARRRSDGRMTALKVILRRGQSGDDTIAAERHGATLQQGFAALHGMVPEVFEFGPDDEDFFIAMELVEGPSLEERLRDGALPCEEAVSHASWLCEFLAEAHTFSLMVEGRPYRLLHNDLKPAHLKIPEQAERKVLDFGIAKALEETRELATDVGRTIAYAAPERLLSERVNVHADFWSLGVMLYEMASGHRPYPDLEGPRYRRQLYSAITSNAARAALPRACPPHLQAIVNRLLAFQPEHRYQSATEIHADLERFAKGERPEAAAWFDTPATMPVTRAAAAAAGAGAGAVAGVRVETGVAATDLRSVTLTASSPLASLAPFVPGAAIPSFSSLSSAPSVPSIASLPPMPIVPATDPVPAATVRPAFSPNGAAATAGAAGLADGDRVAGVGAGAVGVAAGAGAVGATGALHAGGAAVAAAPAATVVAATAAASPKARRSFVRRLLTVTVTVTLVILYLTATEGVAWLFAEHFRNGISAIDERTVMSSHDSYNAVARWSLFDLGLRLRVDRPLVTALRAVGDRVILDYRREVPTMGPEEWRQAQAAFSWARSLSPGDTTLRSKELIAEGHVRRLAAQKARPSSSAVANAQAAVVRFRDAAAADPTSFDPYVGMAVPLVYNLGDVDGALAALDEAAKLGYVATRREKALIGDAYMRRGATSLKRAGVLTGDERHDALVNSRGDYERCVASFAQIVNFGKSAENLNACKAQMRRIDQQMDWAGF